MIGYRELKNKIEKLFQEANIDDFADIDWIMCEILNVKRSMLPLYGAINEAQQSEIMDAVYKRLKHIPIAYIFGRTNFYGYDLVVDKNVLIPRNDTEILIEEVVKLIKQRQNALVLDIGTGSGAIAIVLQKETNAKVYAVDVSEDALRIAKQNAEINNANVEFIHSNLFENISDLKVDFIVSNPPYIETDVVYTLEKEVRDNEPILALDGGKDGLDFYRAIICEARQHLNKNGVIAFEIGYNQAETVKKLMQNEFKNIKVIKDYGNNDRVVIGELIWLKD